MAREQTKGIPLYVSRQVILDLLPLYVTGEASAESRALVEEFLALDESLRQEVDQKALLDPLDIVTTTPKLADDAEVRTLRRIKHVLVWQRRSYAMAIAFSVLSFGGVIWIDKGIRFQFFLSAFPHYFWPCVALAVSCWVNYFYFRRLHKMPK